MVPRPIVLGLIHASTRVTSTSSEGADQYFASPGLEMPSGVFPPRNAPVDSITTSTPA